MEPHKCLARKHLQNPLLKSLQISLSRQQRVGGSNGKKPELGLYTKGPKLFEDFFVFLVYFVLFLRGQAGGTEGGRGVDFS